MGSGEGYQLAAGEQAGERMFECDGNSFRNNAVFL